MIWNLIPTKLVLYAAIVIALLHLTGIYPMPEMWADLWNIIGGWVQDVISWFTDQINPLAIVPVRASPV